jgi:oxygen-dependent protoporphyrinogen oxidase
MPARRRANLALESAVNKDLIGESQRHANASPRQPHGQRVLPAWRAAERDVVRSTSIRRQQYRIHAPTCAGEHKREAARQATKAPSGLENSQSPIRKGQNRQMLSSKRCQNRSVTRKRIAIVGGGIAGLAAAYELEKARASGVAIDYTLYEAQPQLGGTLASEIVDGAVLERGPDSFLTEKPAATELCRELGLAGELIPSNDAARKTYIVVRNRLVALPDGLMFLVPTKLIPTALTPLFSLRTKIRMALELLHPPRPNISDESVAALVRRHFGQEAVDRLADPLLSGIYGGDATQLSAQTVLPRMVEMERQHGSLTRGMLAAHRKMRALARNSSKTQERGAPVFTALRGGMQQLVNALVVRLDPACVNTATPVHSIAKSEDGWIVDTGSAREKGAGSNLEEDTGGKRENFDALILAAPAWVAGALLTPVDASLSAELLGIPYSSSITVNLIYDESAIGPLPEGFGFLVPAVEGRSMLACTFVHRKFLGRTPPGKAVFRAFLGGMNNESLLDQPDSSLIATVRREMSEILGAKSFSANVEPEHFQVSRWRRAMAQYAVGHKTRIDRIKQRLAALPSLRLAGNAYDGIGVPDCIRLGRQAARELAASHATVVVDKQ